MQPTTFLEKLRVWMGFHTAQGRLAKTLYGGVVAFGLHLGERQEETIDRRVGKRETHGDVEWGAV